MGGRAVVVDLSVASVPVRVLLERADGVVERWGPRGPEVLRAHERRRWAALRSEEARRDYLASHLLVREAAATRLERAVEDVAVAQVCERCGGPHGRPRVEGADVHVSLTRAGGWVAAAVAAVRVGVDLEPVAAAERAGEPPHPWVRREAAVKAGAGSLDELRVLPAGPSGPGASARLGSVVAVDVTGPEVPRELAVAVAVPWVRRAGAGRPG